MSTLFDNPNKCKGSWLTVPLSVCRPEVGKRHENTTCPECGREVRVYRYLGSRPERQLMMHVRPKASQS